MYSLLSDINPNADCIFKHVRDPTWFKATYQLIKKKGYVIYRNWKKSGLIAKLYLTYYIYLRLYTIYDWTATSTGQQNGDLTTLGGTTDWCHNYCDGNRWLMYMAFVMNILQLENVGRDFPGEWIQADLGLPTSEEQILALKGLASPCLMQ